VRPALLALAPALAFALFVAPLASAQEPGGPVEVTVDVYVLNVGGYDATKGTYLMDFYLTFSWDAAKAPANFSATRFEFMNGRAASTDKIVDEVDADGVRTVEYRIQANLYSDPQFANYPYDTQTLKIEFEDALHPTGEMVYVSSGGSTLDPDAHVAGWRLVPQAENLTIVAKQYPPDEEFSRARFTLVVEREPLSSTIKSFLPPVAFMVVAGLGFFFHPSKVANRITLGTGMLISAVAFHISQTQSLPPLGKLILFDKVMLCTYVFLVGCLAVSTLIHIDEDYWKDRDYTKQINGYGILATVALTALLFVALVALQ
jgi:hypothetical protein